MEEKEGRKKKRELLKTYLREDGKYLFQTACLSLFPNIPLDLAS